MKRYRYNSYQEYLDIQYKTNEPRISWTLQKEYLRADDIAIIKKHFVGKRCICLGCRHDKEVDDFIDNGFEAIGIDILPTRRQINGDINKLEDYFSENSFDFAYSAHSIEHTDNPIHFLNMVRILCTEGAYFVIPIRENPDIEEPIFFDVMSTKRIDDLKREFEPALGNIDVVDHVIRDDTNHPSGPEIAFAIKWK